MPMNRFPKLSATTARGVSVAVLAGMLAASVPAMAQDNFYEGKTISVLSHTGAGGVNDLFSRTIAKYMTEYVPGNPDFIIQAMPGGGGTTVANHLYNVADQDGTVIASLNQTVGISQLLGEGIEYNTGLFNWIGRATPTTGLVMIYRDSPAQTLEEMRTTRTVFGAQGRASQTYLTPTLMRTLLGLQIDVILGYQSSSEMFLAMERGEVDGRTGALETLLAVNPEWLEDGTIKIVGELSLEDEPSFPGVPMLPQMVTDPADREIMDLIASYTAFGISWAFPPNVPEERVAMFREAFDAVMADPRFLEEMEGYGMDIRPLDGESLQELANAFVDISPELIERTLAALEW